MAGKLGITVQFTENRAIQYMSQSFPRFDKPQLHLVQDKKKSPTEKLCSKNKAMPASTAAAFRFTWSCETKLRSAKKLLSHPSADLTISDSHGGLQGPRRKMAHQHFLFNI